MPLGTFSCSTSFCFFFFFFVPLCSHFSPIQMLTCNSFPPRLVSWSHLIRLADQHYTLCSVCIFLWRLLPLKETPLVLAGAALRLAGMPLISVLHLHFGIRHYRQCSAVNTVNISDSLCPLHFSNCLPVQHHFFLQHTTQHRATDRRRNLFNHH